VNIRFHYYVEPAMRIRQAKHSRIHNSDVRKANQNYWYEDVLKEFNLLAGRDINLS
jgi:hypothetical protein